MYVGVGAGQIRCVRGKRLREVSIPLSDTVILALIYHER